MFLVLVEVEDKSVQSNARRRGQLSSVSDEGSVMMRDRSVMRESR